MKSLLIQQGPGKFLQNCVSAELDNLKIIDIAIDNNLYQTFFRHKPDYCIFSATNISNEIIQFCQDYSDKLSIYFFILDNSVITRLQGVLNNNIKTIGYENTDIIIPSLLINDKLFYTKDGPRYEGIVCFMDGITQLPNSMTDVLYPNTTIPIKMFNCPNIKHYQNLGMVTEQDRAVLLQTHKYYLDLGVPVGLNYKQEAVACGCIPITLEDIANGLYLDKSIDDITPADTITYSHFLKETLHYE